MIGLNVLLLSAIFLTGSVSASSMKIVLKENIVKVGDPIEFLCKAKSSIVSCRMSLPNGASFIMPEFSKRPGETYLGEGFKAGDCGVRVLAATENMDGVFLCALTVEGALEENIGTANVTVARAPSTPELIVSSPQRGNEFQENEKLSAKCQVNNGRPVANITWFIGDDKISDGLSQPLLIELDGKHLYSVEQNLTRRVQTSDNGKELKCVAVHPLLDEKSSTRSKIINVIYPPKEMSQPLERFGLAEGVEGKISVTVLANPRPTFTWVVGEETLSEGQQDQSGRFQTLHGVATPMVEGSWESVLVINPLKNEDVEKSYKLVAKNPLGEATYKLMIYTTPEPKMLELGVGAIVGIVVAVLVLLTIAALLLFARAKGRWCFAGGSTQFAGESSDTESADHHAPTHPKIKKTPFTSVFKKKSEKLSDEESQSKGEEKRFIVSLSNFRKEEERNEAGDVMLKARNPDEGVVYAELDLNLAPGARPTVRADDDKTEYAEIIHTKDTKSE